MTKNVKKSYQKRVHDIFEEFGYCNNDTSRFEYAIVSLINEIAIEAIMEERNKLLKEILNNIEELKEEIKKQNKGNKEMEGEDDRSGKKES